MSFSGNNFAMFGDDHNPPHFHVRYGEFEAIITIRDGVVKGEMPVKFLEMYLLEWNYIKMSSICIGKDCRKAKISLK